MEHIPAYLQRVLEQARWAPSGDNTQPWRFEILGEDHVLVHGFDTRDHVVYDLDGRASQLAIGALLETIQIAASAESYRAHITRRPDTPETTLQFDVYFEQDTSIPSDPLASVIAERVVQRRPMSTRPLTDSQRMGLASALPSGYQVQWFEGLAQRWRMAKLMFDNAKVRLITPEAYEVHKAVIDWGVRFSTDKIPDQAVGVDPLTARFMRWVMADWERVDFFNTWLLGDLPPRIQLDLLPGLACAAHFALFTPVVLRDVDDYLTAGRSLQRFWLTATRLGLFIQPEMTPVIFARYHRQAIIFTKNNKALRLSAALNERLVQMLAKGTVEKLFFLGRLGSGPPPHARSTRLPLEQLIITK